MTAPSPENIDTVIIGAGQAGLAVGYHLTRPGGPSFVILETNDRVGDPWRRRWDSLRLFTPGRYDGLPGLRFPGPAWSFPTKDEMAGYLEGYARRFDLPVRTGVRVDRVRRQDDRYVVACGDTRYVAANVVVATGAYQAPRIPGFAAGLDPAIVQMHSCEYRNLSQLREGPVLVVGAANTGAELALEASRHGHQTWLSGRDVGQETPFRPGSLPDRVVTPPFWFLLSRVLTSRTPVGRRLRRTYSTVGTPLVRIKPKDLAAAGVARVPRTAGVRDGLPVLDDGRVLDVSNVLWCTGFRPDLGWIDLPVLDGHGSPVHERGVVAAYPGLYFVGRFFLHSLTSSLVGGVGRDAGYIARHLVSRHRRLKAELTTNLG
jgi:putative flavoprotein involved in K+ transport